MLIDTAEMIQKSIAGRLVTRLGECARKSFDAHDFAYPDEKDLKYDNPIVRMISTSEENYFNFGLKDNKKSEISFKSCSEREKTFDPDAVRKIKCAYYSNYVCRGIYFYDAKDEIICQSARDLSGASYTIEVKLEAGERIIGFKGRSFSSTHPAAYYDLSFVIGKIE